MARPSPRTQGVDAEGKTFKKFGTQQLKYIDPAQPALGVVEKDVGKTFRGITTGITKAVGIDFGKPTIFSQRQQAGRTGATPANLRVTQQPTFDFDIAGTILPQAFAEGENGECVEADAFCGFREFMEGKPAGTYCKCPNWFG